MINWADERKRFCSLFVFSENDDFLFIQFKRTNIFRTELAYNTKQIELSAKTNRIM